MDEHNIVTLAQLTDAAAENADDFRDVATALRPDIESADDEVHQIAQAFEYHISRQDDGDVFAPMLTYEDGSAYPVPLADVPDPTLALWAAVAAEAEEPAVRARLHDLLFQRRHGNGRKNAQQAADAYLQLGRAWRPITATMELLPRALDLARRVGLGDIAERVREQALSLIQAGLDSADPKPGVPIRLLRLLVDDSGEDGPVDALLERAREVFPSVWDTASIVELQRKRASTDEQRRVLDTELVIKHLETADEADSGLLRGHHLEAAASLARDRGLTDLHDRAVALLQDMDVDDLELQTFTSVAEIPRETIEKYIDAYLDVDSWDEAFERFAFLQPPTGDVDENRATVEEHRREFVLQSLLPPVLLGGDGLPRYRATDDEEIFEIQLAQQEGFRLSFWSNLAVDVLGQIPERFGRPEPDELEGWLRGREHVSAGIARSIRRTLEYFWDEQWEASVGIGVPRIEALARGLVLLLDAPVYRLQRAEAPGQYPGLGALVGILADKGIPESWIRYLRTAFSHVAGQNLRNEHAHGFIDDPGPGVAVIVCHALLFLARQQVSVEADE